MLKNNVFYLSVIQLLDCITDILLSTVNWCSSFSLMSHCHCYCEPVSDDDKAVKMMMKPTVTKTKEE